MSSSSLLHDPSTAARVVARLEPFGLDGAKRAIRAVLARMTPLDRAALVSKWSFWARPKQIAPGGSWRSWGFLTGRSFGKTFAVSKYINEEVRAGRAMLIGLAAQDEENSIAIQVQGPSGLIATASPRMRPQWETTAKQLVWPNGARAYVRTPEVPGKIRGLEYHLSWISELQSWPAALRQEAYDNFLLSTRLGYARTVWDATPKRRHPLLRQLIADYEADPARHPIIRGTTHENAANLGEGYVEDLEKKLGGTLRGREELLGEMLEESETALVKQRWIDDHRRAMPDVLLRRGIGVDPAVSTRGGTDQTGIVDAGLAVDGQAMILGDYSGKHSPPAWAKIVLELYVTGACDVVVLERNKGGDLVVQNLRAGAERAGLKVVVLGDEEMPKRAPGVVYVREVHARGPKEDRAQPLATAYERGKVSHALGVNLSSLEDMLTTWEPTPGQRSPDALDAEVHIVGELLGLGTNRIDHAGGFPGIVEAQRQAIAPPASPSLSRAISAALGGGRGGRI